MNEEREGVFQIVGATVQKEWELKATFERGKCRLAAFYDLEYGQAHMNVKDQ